MNKCMLQWSRVLECIPTKRREGEHQRRPHLSPCSLPCAPSPPLERCCPILSSWMSERFAAPAGPSHCRRVSGAIGWRAADSAVIGPGAAERPASPGSPLGWGLMRS